MTDPTPGCRTTLHDAIQHLTTIDDGLPQGAMLLGWVTIAEWMAPDGARWLSILDGEPRGEGLAQWQRQGYLHNALYEGQGFYTTEDDEDEDEDE